MALRALLFSLALALPGALRAEGRGPALAVASNFSQGLRLPILRLGLALGVTDFRDGTAWRRIERAPGVYDFTAPRAAWPALLAEAGAHGSAVLNWGNPLYQGGATPTEPAALAAFGAFAAALVAEFPSLDALEIGNEINGVNFVRGPMRAMAPLQRARAYAALLTAASTAARAERPGIRILGGAAHSIPAGWLWAVLEAGGAGALDALAHHPYTTPPEQLVRQIAVLRRHPLAADLPIEVTEFGTPDPARAAQHFLQSYCQFALAGVTRAAWYPLSQRGDGMVPLFTDDGRLTPAGRAFHQIAALMEGRPVQDAGGPRLYGCRFGPDVLVLWGAPRSVALPEAVEVRDAAGAEWVGPLEISEAEPMVLIGAVSGVGLGQSPLVADSYHDFAFPQTEEAQAPGDSFARFARLEGVEIPLAALPGQERPGVPWVPYRGNAVLGAARLGAEALLPAIKRGAPVEIVHRFTATSTEVLSLAARFAPAERSADGITVTVTLDGAALFTGAGKTPIEVSLSDLHLTPGAALEIAVGPGATAQGDVTDYRITLRR